MVPSRSSTLLGRVREGCTGFIGGKAVAGEIQRIHRWGDCSVAAWYPRDATHLSSEGFRGFIRAATCRQRDSEDSHEQPPGAGEILRIQRFF